jgi:hypothetical protein
MAKSANRPSAKIAAALLASAVVAAMGVPLHSAADTGCEVLAEDTAFVDVNGLPVDPGRVDPIAYRHVDAGIVVYERTRADAESLVRDLAASGESDPALLDAQTWLVAQAATCKMRAGNKCSGACPGKQSCRRVKKPGKDICQCVHVDRGPGPR